MHFLPLAMSGREAALIGATHLAIAVAGGGDTQGYDPLDLQCLGCTFANACCIQPVRLREGTHSPIVLGQAPTATLNRESYRFEPLIEYPSRGVDRGGILERCFGLGENALQQIWFFREKHSNLLGTLRGVALLTGQGEIADSVGTPFGTRHNMLHLEGNILLSTIGAGARPLEG